MKCSREGRYREEIGSNNFYPPPRTCPLYYQLLPDRASNGHALFEAETACMNDIKAGAKRQEGAEIVRDNSRV